jgi:hypothetical protein
VYATGTADKPGLPTGGSYDAGQLYGADDGGASTWHGTSDGTNNFVALNGGADRSAFTQTIAAGLVAGNKYTLTFDYAFAQGFGGKVGTSDDFITVGLGAFSTNTSPTIDLPAKGFSGWMPASFSFTYEPGTAGNVLSFLAMGTSGLPPYALLDNVSLLSSVPEPSGWALMLLGFGCMGLMVRRRRAASLAA